MVFSRCLGHMTEALTAQSLRAFFFLNGKQRKGETGKKFFFLPFYFFPQYKSGILTQGLYIFSLYLFLSSGDSKESNQGVYFLQQKDCDTRGTINFSLLFSSLFFFFSFSFSTYSYDEKRLQQQLEFLQPIYIGGTLFFDSFLTLICEYFRKGKRARVRARSRLLSLVFVVDSVISR